MELVKPVNNFDPIHGLIMRSLTAKAVMAALELKVFDALEEESATAPALAGRLGLVPERVEALLDLLTAQGLLERDGDTYATLPPTREFLVSTSPLYQGLSMALTMDFTAEVENNVAGLLAGEKLEEKSRAEDWSGEEVMEGTAQDARGTALWAVVDTVAALPGFDRFEAMCDIGGNHGLFTMGVLSRNPAMTGTILDLPAVADQARERCREAGFAGRIETRGFDFHTDPLPEAAFDLVLTSHVLYMFKRDLATAAARIGAGLRPGGWFVSHHYAGRLEGDKADKGTALELLTRLAGYPSHFIEKEELAEALAGAGFTDIVSSPVAPGRLGLITTARKPG